MLKPKSSISHSKKQIEKIINAKRSLKIMGSVSTKDLITENKLLKEELKEARRIISSNKIKLRLHTKSVKIGKKKHHYLEEVIEFLEDLFDAIPGNVYWKTKRGMYLGCNTALAKILHLKSCQDIVGKTDYNLFDKNTAAKIVAIDREVVACDEGRIIEETGFDISGKPAIYLSKKIPLHDKCGAVVGLVGVSLDITERKKYEELLHKEKEKLNYAKEVTAKFIANMQYEVTGRKNTVSVEQNAKEIKEYLERIITLIPGNIYWKDINGRYLFSNSKMVETVGLHSPQDAVGKTIYELAADRTQADFVHNTDVEVMEKNREKQIEETVFDAEEKQLTFFTRKIPLHDLKGKVIGLLGVSLDITERKQAEARALQLAQEKGAVEERMKTIELFSGFLAHELGNSVAGVKINADVLAGFMPTIDELRTGKRMVKDCQKELIVTQDTIKQVTSAANSAEKIFKMILMNMKSASISKDKMQSSSIKQEIAKTLSEYPYRENEKVRLHFTGEDFTYLGIPIYTEHVFLNLLKNSYYALKEAGKGEITIVLEPAKAGDKYHRVIFKDTGGGIAPEFMPKLFQRFASNWRKGTGLGLAFCKTYMNALDGDITCASQPGKYTEFTLSFPVV